MKTTTIDQEKVPMTPYVLGFDAISASQIAVVGGKGLHLAELSHLEGIDVPAGFCVTTHAFKRSLAHTPSLPDLLQHMSCLKEHDRESIHTVSAQIRRTLEGITLPPEVVAEIARAHAGLGENAAYAVRSSATAEDLPTASFAGQHDTSLNVVGLAEILHHVRRCWASLFTERAVTYRLRNGIDPRVVYMAVVVQKMVFPTAAGVLFTANPLTGNRKITCVEACSGLGEALVSGLVQPDTYQVKGGHIVARSISHKHLTIYASPEGGTQQHQVRPELQAQPALTDEQVLHLVQLGRRIEAHFGRPQDMEWCLADEHFHFVQSRPITTLFPIPEAGDGHKHVYLSVGHQQMMTDAMKPLGASFFRMTSARPMYEAGGRLFVDVGPDLASPARRGPLINFLGKADPLTGDALRTLLSRGDFIEEVPDPPAATGPANQGPPPPNYQASLGNDPALVEKLIQEGKATIDALKERIRHHAGPALFDFIVKDVKESWKGMIDPQNFAAIMTGMNASAWLNEKMLEWLGEKNVADTIAQSTTHNVTTEMGLALLDIADVVRPHPELVQFLTGVKDNTFLDSLEALPGGQEAHGVITSFLEKYGIRCVGEIDLTRPRWIEQPSMLVPLILTNVRSFEPGESRRKVERGRLASERKEHEVLERLRTLPEGEQKTRETKDKIDLVRTFMGYREYPKYFIVARYFVYRQALLAEVETLVGRRLLREKEDSFYLSFEELREVVLTGKDVQSLIEQRKAEHRQFEKLFPPRVMTSDGEIFQGEYHVENVPPGAIVGLAVSSGVVEGRARVIRDLADTSPEEGDILVTAFTDPSWTPLFVSIKGLVTEVGGLMTHGAVIAREYGLPAVVGVDKATTLIKDGQRIRVDGTHGFIEILS